MRYLLTLAYDGTPFAGWQVQANALTIQHLVQKALETFLRHPVDLTGAGRTDAGVHALGQTAHFDTELSFDPKRLLLALKALLPPEICPLDLWTVPPSFHARYSAIGKIYHYHLELSPIQNPFSRLYRHQVFGPFDLLSLEKGARFFVGTHDFLSFANTKEKKPEENSIRTLHRIDIVLEEGGLCLEFEGEGFLYKMVRNIVGLLIEVAKGKIRPETIPAILDARDRKKAGPTASAKGLFLMKVLYDAPLREPKPLPTEDAHRNR